MEDDLKIIPANSEKTFFLPTLRPEMFLQQYQVFYIWNLLKANKYLSFGYTLDFFLIESLSLKDSWLQNSFQPKTFCQSRKFLATRLPGYTTISRSAVTNQVRMGFYVCREDQILTQICNNFQYQKNLKQIKDFIQWFYTFIMLNVLPKYINWC